MKPQLLFANLKRSFDERIEQKNPVLISCSERIVFMYIYIPIKDILRQIENQNELRLEHSRFSWF